MRLLIVTTVSVTLRAFLLPFADHFRALGWQVDGMARGAEACDLCRPHFDQLHGIEWSRSPLDYRNLLLALRNVRAVVARNQYDIVHVHTPVAAFLTRLALALPGLPNPPVVIYTAHGFHFHPGGTPLRNAIFSLLERIAGRWTDFLVTINRTDEAAARRLGLVPPERLCYTPGIGIDTHRYAPGAASPEAIAEVYKLTGIPGSSPVFTMIAEFNPGKRHRDVVAAWARMENTASHLIFLGDGKLRAAVEAQVEELDLASRIHFAGNQPDVRPFILASRAVILPSDREGLPRSVMEALSCGVPVIGSAIRGTADLLADGGGSTFPTGDAGALARLLDEFAANPEAAQQKGLIARQSIAKYSIENILALHDELYAAAQKVARKKNA